MLMDHYIIDLGHSTSFESNMSINQNIRIYGEAKFHEQPQKTDKNINIESTKSNRDFLMSNKSDEFS